MFISVEVRVKSGIFFLTVLFALEGYFVVLSGERFVVEVHYKSELTMRRGAHARALLLLNRFDLVTNE